MEQADKELVLQSIHAVKDLVVEELLAQSGEATLERAFNRLTNGADIERATEEVMQALSSF